MHDHVAKMVVYENYKKTFSVSFKKKHQTIIEF